MVKTLTHPETGKTVRLGRRRPVSLSPRCRLSNYLLRGLPSPPKSTNYSQPAASALSQMYLNDQLGDCVIAGIGHLEGVFTAGATGTPLIFSSQDIIALYSAIGGYVPGDASTDNGCDEQTALDYWQRHGAPTNSSHTIAGSLWVNALDPVEWRTALWLFENLCIGMELPDAWVNPFPAGPGFTWDVAGDPDPANGHFVAGVGYNEYGLLIDTWGMLGTLTTPAVKKYAKFGAGGALYTVVSRDALNALSQRAPNGFNWAQLAADFDTLGGHV